MRDTPACTRSLVPAFAEDRISSPDRSNAGLCERASSSTASPCPCHVSPPRTLLQWSLLADVVDARNFFLLCFRTRFIERV